MLLIKMKLNRTKMIKKLLRLLCFSVLFTSCIRTECDNCTKLFDTQLSASELDVIVQDLENDSIVGSVYYQDWNEFTSINFPGLNQTEEVCSKHGGMVSVDPLGDKRDFRQVWYSHGSTDLLLAHDSIFEIGTMYYDCK